MADTTDEQVAQMLEDADGEANVPQKLRGGGHSGPIANVGPVEARQRRRLMSAALVAGVAMETIAAQFMDTYGMSIDSVKHLVSEVRAMWTDEDADAARYAKNTARRRYHGHIREASKDRKWTAVANLEAGLAAIEGTTAVEDEAPTDINARLEDAILHQLQQEGTKGVRMLIQRERMFIELGEHDGTVALPAKTEVIVEAG